MTLRILITGAEGQLGRALIRTAPAGGTVLALDVDQLDITDAAAVRRCCDDHAPSVIVNAAAYTAVDRAEDEADLAYAVNRDGARHLADAAARIDARLVQVSTDFVFGGDQARPYTRGDSPNALGVYGASKLAGEEAVRSSSVRKWLILRTAWVYAADGHNFAKTMLRLMRDGKPVRVVAVQIGTPTWATSLARGVWRAIDLGITGVHHWTDAGVASWYDFAVAIQEEALACGQLATPVPVTPITTKDFPTPARRPLYSVLDKTETWQALDMTAAHWRENLRHMLAELPASSETIDTTAEAIDDPPRQRLAKA